MARLQASSSSKPEACNCKRRPRCRLPSLVFLYSSKCRSFYVLVIFTMLFILFHIRMTASWDFMHQLKKNFITTKTSPKKATALMQDDRCRSQELEYMVREAVTFLPLKDLRFSSKALEGHTWFMSSMLDTQERGEVQYQEFPSKASKGRILCLKGRDNHDGSWNSYALAWPQALPPNATALIKGLTFVSYNHYNYDNIWHGLSAVVPFIAWHIKNQCLSLPKRWVLYHRGELRTAMGPWLSSLMKAMFGVRLNIDMIERAPACFERAVVMRHNEGGMSRERRLQVYDLLRCKARNFCNVSLDKGSFPVIGMTMFMRTGPRSFKNVTTVIEIFRRACREVEGCHMMVAYASNLSFCQQVKLMSLTDILVSPHGAQLTNMFLMDRNSSVMEFFPKGWLRLAGVGQYVYHWIASWSGMNHRGAWRDPSGDSCPFPEDDRRCMSIYKNAKIGYNDSYFYEWARHVLSEARLRKTQQIWNRSRVSSSNSCPCYLS